MATRLRQRVTIRDPSTTKLTPRLMNKHTSLLKNKKSAKTTPKAKSFTTKSLIKVHRKLK